MGGFESTHPPTHLHTTYTGTIETEERPQQKLTGGWISRSTQAAKAEVEVNGGAVDGGWIWWTELLTRSCFMGPWYCSLFERAPHKSY